MYSLLSWKKTTRLILVIVLVVSWIYKSEAQKPRLAKDYSFVMELPAIVAIESSLTHLYVLSKAEGMAVFRSRPDTLQWLYTSPGMQQRGNILDADIRFAYLYGHRNRFSVLEPTSVVGVYSSTNLPTQPKGVHRIGMDLYLGLDTLGIGRLSLQSPSAFDSTITYVNSNELGKSRILHLTGRHNTLLVSTDQPNILQYDFEDGELQFQKRIPTEQPFTYVHPTSNSIYASTDEGEVIRIEQTGNREVVGTIGETVKKIRKWNDWLIIRGESQRLWTVYKQNEPVLWKDNGRAGNFFTINKGRFWINEYNKISQIKEIDPLAESRRDTLGLFTDITELNLQSVKNRTIPLPHPVLIPLELKEQYPIEAIQFTYESPTIEDAYLRKQGFYWQPGSEDVGSHRVTVIATASSGATDSIQFNIEIKSFNTPPRFTPMRTLTVPAGEKFTLPIKAFDPDGTYRDLIRYLGMNLPEGGNIDQRTGKFEWTPTAEQTGKHSFKVIATDQFGAASSEQVTLNVISKPRQEE